MRKKISGCKGDKMNAEMLIIGVGIEIFAGIVYIFTAYPMDVFALLVMLVGCMLALGGVISEKV
jgi:hypothetical protein